MIEITGLTKYFYPPAPWFSRGKRRTVTALENINLTVKSGEVVGLMGPNGAGKTTLLKILATLIRPDRGSARLDDCPIVDEPNRVRSLIGLVTGEERSFYWRLTGRQNLEFFGAFYGLARDAVRRRLEELATLITPEALDRRVGEYSSGLRQRLNLIRALLHQPPILLLDEPTRSLDPATALFLRRFIRDELAGRQGKTILMATHNLTEAGEICHRVAWLKEGKLIAMGPPETIADKTLPA